MKITPPNNLTNKPTNKPTIQPFPFSQTSITRLKAEGKKLKAKITHPNQLTNQLTNQPPNKPTTQQTNQPTNQQTNKPFPFSQTSITRLKAEGKKLKAKITHPNQLTNQLTNQPPNKPTTQQTNQPTN